MILSPILAFALAISVSLVWFGAVVAVLGGAQPSPVAHIGILIAPVTLSALVQHFSTRQLPLPIGRRILQIGAAAVLAPVLATTVIWVVRVVVLGHGE